jgi:hypothetical protein
MDSRMGHLEVLKGMRKGGGGMGVSENSPTYLPYYCPIMTSILFK